MLASRRQGVFPFFILGTCVLAVFGSVGLLGAVDPPQAPATTTRVSVDSAGGQANGESTGPSISADGRFVAFVSWAANLVPGDTNDLADVLLKDMLTGAVTRASIATSGAQSDGESFAPSISGDGRLVAFVSEATDLALDDTNDVRDVFVHDLVTGTTSRVSVGSGGEQGTGSSFAPNLSADGRFVAFATHADNLTPGDLNKESDVLVKNLSTGALERVSVTPAGEDANGPSEAPSISSDGRYVTFASTASNLLPSTQAPDTNGAWDVFVRDRNLGTVVRVSVGAGGAQGNGQSWMPAISSDGRRISFASRATTLVPDDTNESLDVFVHDSQAATTTRVSVGSGGVQADGVSSASAISGDGRWVVFCSHATNLVAGDTNGAQDVFIHDRESGVTTRATVGLYGQASGTALWPTISRDGHFIAFPDVAGNLAPGDTNAKLDVFVRGPL